MVKMAVSDLPKSVKIDFIHLRSKWQENCKISTVIFSKEIPNLPAQVCTNLETIISGMSYIIFLKMCSRALPLSKITL